MYKLYMHYSLCSGYHSIKGHVSCTGITAPSIRYNSSCCCQVARLTEYQTAVGSYPLFETKTASDHTLLSFTNTMNEELLCPICLLSSSSCEDILESTAVVFMKSPCGHVACAPCFERLLLITEPLHDFLRWRNSLDERNPSLLYDQAMDDIVASCPTRGKCPICRVWVDLFHLTPIVKNCSSTIPILQRITDLTLCPIYDMIFLPSNKGSEGSSMSFHFTTLSQGSTASYPFIRFEHSSYSNTDSRCMGYDKPFQSDFFFFPKSNSFHGKIDWTEVRLSYMYPRPYFG